MKCLFSLRQRMNRENYFLFCNMCCILLLSVETNQKRLVHRSFSWLVGDWTLAIFFLGFSLFFFWFGLFFLCLGNLSFEERPGEQSAFRQLRWAHCGRWFQQGRPWAVSLTRSFERCIRVAAANNGCVNDDAISRRRRSVVSPPDRLTVERRTPPGSRIERRSIIR